MKKESDEYLPGAAARRAPPPGRARGGRGRPGPKEQALTVRNERK